MSLFRLKEQRGSSYINLWMKLKVSYLQRELYTVKNIGVQSQKLFQIPGMSLLLTTFVIHSDFLHEDFIALSFQQGDLELLCFQAPAEAPDTFHCH